MNYIIIPDFLGKIRVINICLNTIITDHSFSSTSIMEFFPEFIAQWLHINHGCFYSTCLSSNGSGSYAAIVMFAGARLASQHRQTSADRTQIANYLEDRNSASHPNAGGNADYRSGPASAGFNDKLYCIDIGLGVAPCP